MTLENITAQYLDQARNGDASARENILSGAKAFILQTCSKFCGKPLEWGRDDELSIGLMAFNEAIDRFDRGRNIPFLGFARLVIKSRLADYFRTENRHRHQPLEYSGEDQAPILMETEKAWENYLKEAENRERQEEVLEFQRELLKYGISISELVEASPKHRDSREGLIKISRQLAQNSELMGLLLQTNKLPIKELTSITDLHRKTIEKGRRYIIAMALLFYWQDKYIYLYSYLKYNG